MAQATDYELANQSGASFRAELNTILAAIASANSGATEPTTMYAYMLWADTSSGLLKQRNAANDAWINIYELSSAEAAAIADGTVSTTKIVDDAVTYAKLQNVSATSRILGRKTAAAGDTEECTLSEILDFIGSAAQGDILYRGASSWARLAAGTSGQFLKTQGAGANPAWDNVMSAGSIIGYQVFTGSGNYDKTVNNPSFVIVEVIGAGGRGGALGSASSSQSSTGGGAGGYARKLLNNSSLSASETVTVGTNGGTSSFGSHCSATGGANGTGLATVRTASEGGVGSGGDVNIKGNSAPFDGVAGSRGGVGAGSVFGGGGQGAQSDSAASSSTTFGAGSGGTFKSTGGSTVQGGTTAGAVIVWEYR